MVFVFSPFQFAGFAHAAKTRWRLFLLISQLCSLVILPRYEYYPYCHIFRLLSTWVVKISYLGTYGNSHWARNAETRFEFWPWHWVELKVFSIVHMLR